MAGQKTLHVYSRLANSQRYTTHTKGANDMPIPAGEVLIHGGANLPDKQLFTPMGVHTEISENDYELLKANSVFEQHVKNGFVTVEERKHDVEKVASDMGDKTDPSAPLTDSDYKDADGETTPTVRTNGGKRK